VPIGLKGNSDGSGAIQIGGSDAISISTGLNTTFAGTITATGTVAGTTGTLYPLVSGTAVASTSGTAIDFTGIPSWAKRITVMFSGVSQNSTQYIGVQLGTSSGVETTGYTTRCAPTTGSGDTSTQMFLADAQGTAANLLNGIMTIALIGSNIWVYGSTISVTSGGLQYIGSGTKTLSGTLDRVRITTPNGTATFDAGSINILFE
jgi:hypothetical protein